MTSFFYCAGLKCSHMCLVREKTGEPYCTCPQGSGLVLNNDDETCGAPPTCSSEQFTCTSGGPHFCIPLQWRCDGQAECSDFSDEINCPECGNGNFRCRNGLCIVSKWNTKYNFKTVQCHNRNFFCRMPHLSVIMLLTATTPRTS